MQNRLEALSRALAVAAIAGSTLSAQAANVVTGAQDLGTFTAPVTLTYSHAFNDTDLSLAGLQLSGVPGTVFATDTFYDDFGFQIDGSSFSSITATIDLGRSFDIGNLSVRLYRGSLQTTTTGAVGPALMQAWSTNLQLAAQGTGSGDVQVIAPIDLSPGSYVLEVRGNILGGNGGSYAGVLNLAPVPEPGTIGLMLAGLGVLGFVGRRRGT